MSEAHESVVEEVRAAFQAYERDLLANDLRALDRWFCDDELVVRFAFDEAQFGAAAVAAARRGVPMQTPPRTIEQLEIRPWGRDVAGVFAVCRLRDSRHVVHQSQVWLRTAAGWRVTAAHVSRA